MEPVEGSRALHRRRGKDGHDQQGDLQPLPAGAPQCRGNRCGPGRSELRGDRRGGEPATRTESANAEAAGGCGSFNIGTTPINVQEADIERAVSAFAQSPNSGMITAVSAAALEHKDLIIKLATQFRLPVVYAYRVFCGSRLSDELRNRHYWTVHRPFGVKRFQTVRWSVSMSLTGSCFSSESA